MGKAVARGFHCYSNSDIKKIQKLLMDWFNKNKREMPWRNIQNCSRQDRAYRVLVSEIMLQQTRVSTVIDYFERWISKWPNLKSLSTATEEEVQLAWKGLGYYSRARRLHKLAKVLSPECTLPSSAEDLIKLPGIGRYTSGAVASNVFNERVPSVDGNAIRVLCRLRVIDADVSTATVNKHIWDLADSLVPDQNPGNWNQALMELGALVCTPVNANCSECPISDHCFAAKSVTHDIEDCALCLPRNGKPPMVSDYPRKKVKNVRDENQVACIVVAGTDKDERFFVVKRNSSGLLAGLWQFPLFLSSESSSSSVVLAAKKLMIKECKLLNNSRIRYLGSVLHKFTHINMNYSVVMVTVPTEQRLVTPTDCCDSQWISESQFDALAVSTAMRKVYDLYMSASKRKKRKL